MSANASSAPPRKPPPTPEERQARRQARQRERDARLERLAAGYRDDFVGLLDKFLVAQPTVREIRHAAAKNPSFWVQGVSLISKLAGYEDKVTVHVKGAVAFLTEVQGLSDSQLAQRVEELWEERKNGVAGSPRMLPPKPEPDPAPGE